MNRRALATVFSVAAAGAVAACTSSSSPTQPSGTVATAAAAPTTASVASPRPLLPANNSQIRYLDQPVTIVAQNAIVTQAGPTTYTFEVATDAAFGAKVQTRDAVAEGVGGQTSVRLDQLAPARDYFWHARATSGGTTGVFGAAYKFTMGAQIIINAPAGLTPAAGAQTNARPSFVITNAPRQGPAGAITYRFEISTASTFSPVLLTATVSEGPAATTTFTPSSDLPAETTLFWRVTAVDAANGLTTAPSGTLSFATALAIDLTRVTYLLGPNLSTWRETGRIIAVEQDGNHATGGPMCISFTDPGWPDAKWIYAQPGDDPNFGIYGNQWYFAKIGGRWYGGPGEWLYRGAATCKAGQGTRTIGPDSGFGPPFSTWVPQVGELVGYAVSASARALPLMSTVQERTNVVLQPWHDSAIQGFSLARQPAFPAPALKR